MRKYLLMLALTMVAFQAKAGLEIVRIGDCPERADNAVSCQEVIHKIYEKQISLGVISDNPEAHYVLSDMLNKVGIVTRAAALCEITEDEVEAQCSDIMSEFENLAF